MQVELPLQVTVDLYRHLYGESLMLRWFLEPGMLPAEKVPEYEASLALCEAVCDALTEAALQ